MRHDGCYIRHTRHSEPVLNERFALHDIRDVEAYCAQILHRHDHQLNPTDREDLLAYLIETAWELSLKYDPAGRPARFGVYAHPILQRRVTDWKRQRHGRTTWTFGTHTYTRPRPVVESLDELGHAEPEAGRDPAAHGDTGDLVRLLRARGSSEAWDNDTGRKAVPPRAA